MGYAVDLREFMVATYSGASPRVSMKVVHLPTGRIAVGEGNYRHRLRNRLINEIARTLMKEAVTTDDHRETDESQRDLPSM